MSSERYLKNREAILAQQAERYRNDPDFKARKLASSRAGYAANREARRAQQKVYNSTPEAKSRARESNRKKMRVLSGAVGATSETRHGDCPLCTRKGVQLHFDHSHTTGQFRGWICGSCNRGLGLFKDSPAALLRAARYVSPIIDAVFD